MTSDTPLEAREHCPICEHRLTDHDTRTRDSGAVVYECPDLRQVTA